MASYDTAQALTTQDKKPVSSSVAGERKVILAKGTERAESFFSLHTHSWFAQSRTFVDRLAA